MYSCMRSTQFGNARRTVRIPAAYMCACACIPFQCIVCLKYLYI